MIFKRLLQWPVLMVLPAVISACQEREIHNRPSDKSIKEESVESADEYLSEDFGILLKKYEDPTRELWQNPDLVVEKLGNLSGKVVADIGVGTGYFTFKIASDAEKVIAIDVENKFLEYIEERKFELGSAAIGRKIETRLCQPEDPLLKPGEVNVALIVDTYHFINNRVAYMKKVHQGLQPGGMVMLVDYKSGEMPVGPPENIKIKLSTTVKELKNAGFTINEIDTASLQFQYIIEALK